MSKSVELTEYANAVPLHPESDEYSARLRIGMGESEQIEIDIWEDGKSFVIDWPTKEGVDSLKSALPPDAFGQHSAVAVFYDNGTRVKIESRYDYIHSELKPTHKLESLRLIIGADELALFVSSDDRPNRFEFKTRDGNIQNFEEIFDMIEPIIPAEDISTDEIRQKIRELTS